MHKLKLAVLFTLYSYLCYSQTYANIDFRQTEWKSDSLILTEDNHWKEYLFIDSSFNFTRATHGLGNYVLDEGELIDSKHIESAKRKYFVEILDSNTIILKSNDFIGFYHGKKVKDQEDFNRMTNRFILGDSIRLILLGEWLYKSHTIEFAEHMRAFEGDKDMEGRLEKLRGVNIKEGFTMKFLQDNSLIISDIDSDPKKFYAIFSERISLRYSDVIMYFDYEIISPNEVRVEYKRNLGSNFITLTKTN